MAYTALGQAYPAEAGVLIGLMVSIVGIVGVVFGTTAGLAVARIGARRAILGGLGAGGRRFAGGVVSAALSLDDAGPRA